MIIVNFLAQLWGFSLIVVCLSFLVNPKNIKSAFRFVEDQTVLLLVGMINVILGILLILFYNVWGLNWKVIITILGWLVLLRGTVILFFPSFVQNMVAKLKNKQDAISAVLVVVLLIGCFLVYMGFIN